MCGGIKLPCPCRVDTQEMADTLPTVLNLAAAGGLDLASASDMVTDAMSALGMETSDANKMVDQMGKNCIKHKYLCRTAWRRSLDHWCNSKDSQRWNCRIKYSTWYLGE